MVSSIRGGCCPVHFHPARLRAAAALLAAAAGLAGQAAVDPGTAAIVGKTGGTLTVPIDRADAGLGIGALEFELGRPFAPNRPTVFVVADGQQFFLRHGAMPDL
jgi:hypothetical protein